MKKIIFIPILFIFFGNVFSQKVSPTIQLSEHAIPDTVGFYITAVITNDILKYTIKNYKDEKFKSFYVIPNTETQFISEYTKSLESICTTCKNSDEQIKYLYTFFNAEKIKTFENLNHEPVAGKLCFNDEVSIMRYKFFRTLLKDKTEWLKDTNLIEYSINGYTLEIERFINKKNSKIKNRYTILNFKNEEEKIIICNNEFLSYKNLYSKIRDTINVNKEDKQKFKKKCLRKKCLKKDFISQLSLEYEGKTILSDNIIIQYQNNEYYTIIKKDEGDTKERTRYKSYSKMIKDLEKLFIDSLNIVLQKKYINLKEEQVKFEYKEDSLVHIKKITGGLIKKLNDKFSLNEKNYLNSKSDYNKAFIKIDKSLNKLNNDKFKEILNKSIIIKYYKMKIDSNFKESLISNKIIEQHISDNIKTLLNNTLTSLSDSLTSLSASELINKQNDSIEYSKLAKIYEIFYDDYIDFYNKKELSDTNKEKYEVSKEHIDSLRIELIEIDNKIINMREKINGNNVEIESLSKKLLKIQYYVSEITVQFKDGFIDYIEVEGEIDKKFSYKTDKKIIFKNRYPFGFTRKSDYNKALKKQKLYYNDDEIMYELKMNDLYSDYDFKLVPGRRDYSPKNDTVTFNKSNNFSKTLKKENIMNLFDVKVFSDIRGFKQENPNGLVQTEISMKIKLLTIRWWNWKFPLSNIGIFSYIYPEFKFSKLEENEKQLPVQNKENFINNIYSPVNYISTLDLKQYEKFNTGFDINLFLCDMKRIGSVFYIDAGFRYGITELSDSIKENNNGTLAYKNINNFEVNTYRVFAKITWEVRGNEHLSSKFAWQLNNYYLRENEHRVIQVANNYIYKNFNEEGENKWYQTISMLFRCKPDKSKKSYLFFRYNFNYLLGYWNTNFQQMQFGYSLHLSELIK